MWRPRAGFAGCDRHHVGRAMLTTSIILVAGFGTFVFALNIALMRFGILIALTVMSALLVDLIHSPGTAAPILSRKQGQRGEPMKTTCTTTVIRRPLSSGHSHQCSDHRNGCSLADTNHS